MKKFAMAALVAAAPLAAQSFEVGAFIGQQTNKSLDILGATTEVKGKTILGARVGYSLVDIGPALFQVTAGLQPKSESRIDLLGIDTGRKYQHQHMSLGAMFNFKAVVAVGAGVEYRFEKLNYTNSGIGDVSYARPWFRGNLGMAFPTPLVKPFIGLEMAMPLTSKSYNSGGSQEDFIKALAPKLQIGVYGGIRF